MCGVVVFVDSFVAIATKNKDIVEVKTSQAALVIKLLSLARESSQKKITITL